MAARRVILLGATGSIGRQACDVIARHPDHFRIVGAVARRNVAALRDICDRFDVTNVAIVDPQEGDVIPSQWGIGLDAACAVAARDAEVALVAIGGAAALDPALAAIDRGTDVALATKEVLVMAGDVVARRAQRSGSRLLPVDSEHSALWQCLRGEDPATVARLILTASGGPFRQRDATTLDAVTPAEALRHPNWTMGAKITIDSATMMNKGLEIIEAHHLFGIDYSHIDVVIHPSSTVHSMVEFCDGTTLAQLGQPDMRAPIALALNAGHRLPDVAPSLDIRAASPLEFLPLDDAKFPAVALARRAGLAGGASPAILNAANEMAVASFLSGQLGFGQIVPVVSEILAAGVSLPAESLAEIRAADAWAREQAIARVAQAAG